MKRHLIILLAFTAHAQVRYTLQQALQTARANNPDLKSEHFNIDIAAGDETTAGLRPNLTLGFNYLSPAATRYYLADGVFNGANTQAQVQLGKTFQMPASRMRKLAFASGMKSLATLNYREKERALFYEVALKWVGVWGAKKKYDVVKLAELRLDSLLMGNTKKGNARMLPESDMERITLLRNQYELEMKSSEQELKNQALDLKYSLGVDDDIYIETKDNFAYPVPQDLESLLAGAVGARTDLLAAQTAISVAETDIRLQHTLAFPQPQIGMLYNPQNAVPYIGVYGTMDIPVFSRNQGEIRKAEYRKQQAAQALEGSQVQIRKEITSAFNSYAALKSNVADYAKLVAQSERILLGIRSAYLKGNTTITDFLDVQRSSLETQLEYNELLQQYRERYVRLLYTSGLIEGLAQ